MRIIEGDLASADVLALLQEHLASAAVESPAASVHALGLESLSAPGLTFWSLRETDELLGFGALKELDANTGEIKSMRTAARHYGRGVGSRILRHIVDVARERGYSQLLLETGSSPEYAPAYALYQKFGFTFCAPFADYQEDPHCRFMMLQL
ncbi:MAG: GNAT family N-acetyltransferase [Gammaproteobacteria bacterium]|nr:GNAT family N-acetyltransferase [Gammaproteobacteria bacterium]